MSRKTPTIPEFTERHAAFVAALRHATRDWSVPVDPERHPESVWAQLGWTLFVAGIDYGAEREARRDEPE